MSQVPEAGPVRLACWLASVRDERLVVDSCVSRAVSPA